MFDDLMSRLAMLFLLFALISSGFVINVGMSCQMQRFLSSNMFGMHLVGWLMTFVFLAMEGGMSFDPEFDKQAPTDWTRANMISTAIISTFMYSVFVLSSKMQLIPNMIYYALLMMLYVTITHRRFLRDRHKISKTQDDQLQRLIQAILVAVICVGAYGLYDYVGYEKRKHGDEFSWIRFIVGKRVCST